MATFLVIVIFALIGLIRVILKKKYASEFVGGEAGAIKDVLVFAKKYPAAGKLLITLTIVQYVIAVVFLAIISWRIIYP